ncbi:MAG: transglutaminase domain-containing protein [Gemmataceae bacterium]
MKPLRKRAWLLSLLAGLFAGPACQIQAGEAKAPAISKRSPGMKGPAHALDLPVPRSFDLTHVEPEHYAQALGKDPRRIFEFVRDHIAFEPYSGCLRGPRGTLLAMAGNSVDRAALLAALLEQSGQKVRFVRGVLPDALARELVTSLWAERPRPVAVGEDKETSPMLKKVRDTMAAAIKRDYNLIRDHVQKAEKRPGPDLGPTLEALVKETTAHYWVQMRKDGKWLDLDPSFADAAPGRAIAEAKDVLERLPEDVFHRVEIRVRVEEYPLLLKGKDVSKPGNRVVLTHQARAADLSGRDLLLVHQPEGWKGPAKDLASAVAGAAKNSGRLKPVVLAAEGKWLGGEPFRVEPPTGKGLGGIGDLLGGEGTRTPAPVITAEWIECDFIFPDGRKETVEREVFDLVGRTETGVGTPLPMDEVRALTAVAPAALRRRLLSLFFTTGRIDAVHLRQERKEDAVPKDKSMGGRPLLRRIATALAARSDALFDRPPRDKDFLRFYADSPRLHIVDFDGGNGRFTIDLRRDRVRVVALERRETVFPARVFRGVVEGALETALIDHLTAHVRKKEAWPPILSTSAMFSRARAESVPLVFLSAGAAAPKEAPKKAQARVRQALAKGHWVLTPERGLALGKSPRLAWWQIDPSTGETVAVTDEGLHGTTSSENVILISKKHGDTVDVIIEGEIMSDCVTVLWQDLTIFLREEVPFITLPGYWTIDFF